MRISDWSSDVCSSDLPEFLIEAETLLAKSEECLSHLQLINNDKDAIDCMLSTLLKLANKADALALEAVSEFSMHIRSEEHTSELQSLMRISYAVFCLKKKITQYK